MHADCATTERHLGYMEAYEMAAQHIEEALFAAFDLWPGVPRCARCGNKPAGKPGAPGASGRYCAECIAEEVARG